MIARALDLEAALQDPASVFGAPEEVAAHPRLTRDQKIEILRSWEYDAGEAEVATEEGMPGGHDDLLRRILLVLDRLIKGTDVGDSGPTKHHALRRSRARPK